MIDGSSEYWDSAAVAWLVRLGMVPYEAGATAKHNVLESALPNPNLALVESTARLHSPGMPALLLARLMDSANVRPPAQRRFLKTPRRFKSLKNRPTGYRTGHFPAILAEKRRPAMTSEAK